MHILQVRSQRHLVHIYTYTCIYKYMYIYIYTHTHTHIFYRSGLSASSSASYGVATVSRIDEIPGLFCRISSLL